MIENEHRNENANDNEIPYDLSEDDELRIILSKINFDKVDKTWKNLSDDEYERAATAREEQDQYERDMIYHFAAVKCHDKVKAERLIKFETIEELDIFREKVTKWNQLTRFEAPDSKGWEWVFLSRPQLKRVFNHSTILPDDIGRSVEVMTENEKWEIIGKVPITIDKLFSIKGMHYMRYTYEEIRKTLIDSFTAQGKFVLVSRKGSTIVFEYDDIKPRFVTCDSAVEAKLFIYNLYVDFKNCEYALITEHLNSYKESYIQQEFKKTSKEWMKRLNMYRDRKKRNEKRKTAKNK